MKAVFYQRDFSQKIKSFPEAKVERYSWNMRGGPWKATLSIPATSDKWEMLKLLRCPVEIYGADSRLNWWGFVNRVAIPQGVQRFGYGLDNMTNHIVVRYESEGLTEAASDALSIDEYGQKESIIRSFDSTGLEASQLRSVELQDRKYPKPEIEFSGGNEVIEIECLGWYESLRWMHYTNTNESNVENTTQISSVVSSAGQFIQGTEIENLAGVVSNTLRDARDGLSCVNELLQAGTSNNRPLLAYVDNNRYLHVYERSQEPPLGSVDYVMRDDGSLETVAGGSDVPDQHCTVAKWVQAKGSPIEFSFFIESAEYDSDKDKTTYRPAGGYEQSRLAKYIADVVTGDGHHIWPSLIPSGMDAQNFEPFWVALGKEGDDITSVRAVAWDSTTNMLYAGGSFTEIGGVEVTNIARLDMSTGQWYPLETSGAPGLTNTVWSLALIEGDKLYVGTQGAGVGCFWEYDLSTETWTDLSSGTSGPVLTLAVDGTDVYLGGSFSSMPGSAASDYISKWNGATFDALASGLSWSGGGTGGCYDIEISGGVLYAVGKFDSASGTPAANIAAWNGTSWSAMGDGLGAASGVLSVAVFGGYVYADNGTGSYQLMRWDGSAWATVGTFTGGSGDIGALEVSDDGFYLYVVGDFTAVNGVTVGNSTVWDGSSFYAMNEGLAGATVTNPDITMFDGVHPVVGGNFTTADGLPAHGIAMYITTLQGLIDHLTNTGGVARPGGPDQAIQYNYDGRFGGEKELRYDYTNNVLIMGGVTVPIVGTNIFHQILEGASPSHGLWAFTSSYAGFVKFMKANGDATTPTALQADEVMGRIRAAGYDGSNWSASQTEIRLLSKEVWDSSGHGTYIDVYVTPENSTTLTKIATIDEDGIDLAVGLNFSVNGTPVTSSSGWDGDIADVDTTSGSEIGAALQDADRLLADDDSSGNPVWILLSRVWTYIEVKLKAVTDLSSYSWFLDEDTMSSNSATKTSSQQALKAYADTKKGQQLFLMNGYADTIPAGATRYMPLHEDGGVWASAYQDLISAAGSMKNAYFNTNSAQPASGSLVFTLQDDGVDTALVVTVPAGSGAGQFTDLVHSVSIAAGSSCQWKIVNNASSASASIIASSCMLEFT